jgi:cell division protein FtsX
MNRQLICTVIIVLGLLGACFGIAYAVDRVASGSNVEVQG